MVEIDSYEILKEKIENKEKFVLYVSSETCSVCKADRESIENILKKHKISAYSADADKAPVISGQMSIFASPAVLIFLDGREIFRQARFIDFKEVEKIIVQIEDI